MLLSQLHGQRPHLWIILGSGHIRKLNFSLLNTQTLKHSIKHLTLINLLNTQTLTLFIVMCALQLEWKFIFRLTHIDWITTIYVVLEMVMVTRSLSHPWPMLCISNRDDDSNEIISPFIHVMYIWWWWQ